MPDKTTEKNTGDKTGKPLSSQGQHRAEPGTLGGPAPKEGKVKPGARDTESDGD